MFKLNEIKNNESVEDNNKKGLFKMTNIKNIKTKIVTLGVIAVALMGVGAQTSQANQVQAARNEIAVNGTRHFRHVHVRRGGRHSRKARRARKHARRNKRHRRHSKRSSRRRHKTYRRRHAKKRYSKRRSIRRRRRYGKKRVRHYTSHEVAVNADDNNYSNDNNVPVVVTPVKSAHKTSNRSIPVKVTPINNHNKSTSAILTPIKTDDNGNTKAVLTPIEKGHKTAGSTTVIVKSNDNKISKPIVLKPTNNGYQGHAATPTESSQKHFDTLDDYNVFCDPKYGIKLDINGPTDGHGFVNYNTATPSDMGLPQLLTSHPLIYLENATKENKEETITAINTWKPEINAQLTNDKSKAQVIINFSDEMPSGWSENIQGVTTYNDDGAHIVIYRRWLEDPHNATDDLGFASVITHELGHAWGLQHDMNPESIMSYSGPLSRKNASLFQKMPTVTPQNRAMLRKMYSPQNLVKKINHKKAVLNGEKENLNVYKIWAQRGSKTPVYFKEGAEKESMSDYKADIDKQMSIVNQKLAVLNELAARNK